MDSILWPPILGDYYSSRGKREGCAHVETCLKSGCNKELKASYDNKEPHHLLSSQNIVT